MHTALELTYWCLVLQIKIICSSGGHFQKVTGGGMEYVGGETRLISVSSACDFAELSAALDRVTGSLTIHSGQSIASGSDCHDKIQRYWKNSRDISLQSPALQLVFEKLFHKCTPLIEKLKDEMLKVVFYLPPQKPCKTCGFTCLYILLRDIRRCLCMSIKKDVSLHAR